MPLFIFEENISTAATRLRRGASPCGVMGRQLKEWLLQHKVSLEKLRKEMSLWVNHLTNSSLCYASYRALNTGCGLPANKLPGVPPLNTVDIWMCFISKCIMEQAKTKLQQPTATYNSVEAYNVASRPIYTPYV